MSDEDPEKKRLKRHPAGVIVRQIMAMAVFWSFGWLIATCGPRLGY